MGVPVAAGAGRQAGAARGIRRDRAAIEARLAPFEVEVVRVARSARDGVHGIDELPGLLPDADVVVLFLPLTDDTRGLVDADFLAAMRGRRAAGQRGSGRRGGHRRPGGRAARGSDPRPRSTSPSPSRYRSTARSGLRPDSYLPHVGGASSAMWPRAHGLVRDQLHRYAAWRAPGQRDDRAVRGRTRAVRRLRTWQAGSVTTTSQRCVRRPGSTTYLVLRHAEQRRRRLPEGPLPLPRREVPVVQREPARGAFTTASAAKPAAMSSTS